ncbi:MAG: RtcB family protein [Calditrichaceae bacterium]
MKFKEYTINKLDDFLYEIPRIGGMLQPGRIYASPAMMNDFIKEKEPLQQVINVAHLPGIEKYSLAMPDIHWGYGFPIGGVAATDWQDGVISPGGVGYDINCGVRLASTSLTHTDVIKRLPALIEELFRVIPTGLGSSNAIKKLGNSEMKKLLEQGVPWIISQGYGTENDIENVEERGHLRQADTAAVSSRAMERGQVQMGTLGSGNHFLEVDLVEHIYHAEAAETMGLFKDQIVVLIHTGSRGFGYQVCDDYLKVMGKAASKYRISLPDRQLASAPVQSPEGREYLAAMACAANFAWCNRQVIMDLARKAFRKVFGMPDDELNFRLIYDVSHNIAKKETHTVNNREKQVCVHRKGATRAFAPENPDIPERYRKIGQPVLIPGDMGRYSFICTGTLKAESDTFGSTCHGAGRMYSRNQAKRMSQGRNLIKEMNDMGVVVQARGKATIAEEMPYAYKDVADVVDIMHHNGISLKVAKLKPLGVIKG